MSTLPNWVYDLVTALEQYEDAGHHLRPDWDIEDDAAACAGRWLSLIPQDVRDCAEAIATYRQRTIDGNGTNPEPEPEPQPRCTSRYSAVGTYRQCISQLGHSGYHRSDGGLIWTNGEQA